MEVQEAIELLKGMQNPLQDYADMVGAPAFAYGHRYVYPEPEDYAIEEAITALKEKKYKSWIPVSERMPDDCVNPITEDAYVYPVTVQLGEITDIRYYSFCRGHWYNQGPEEMDDLVIAWMPRPEPYMPQTLKYADNDVAQPGLMPAT